MKIKYHIVTLSFFLIIHSAVYAQPIEGGLYGPAIYTFKDSLSTFGLASFNPLTGSSDYYLPLDTLTGFGPYNATIDPLNKRCTSFFKTIDETYSLITFDLETGVLIHQTPIQSLGDSKFYLDPPFFNPADSSLYTIYRNNHISDSLRIVKVNPSNGILSTVASIAPGTTQLTSNGFDTRNQIIYALRYDDLFKAYLVAIDLNHQSTTTIGIQETFYNYSHYNLVFNCNDGMLYGTSIDFPGNDSGNDIIRINPQNGQIDVLEYVGGEFGKIALDPIENRLYTYQVHWPPDAAQFCTYDISAGSLSCTNYTGDGLMDGFWFDIYLSQQKPSADFIGGNFCFSGITHFVSLGDAYNWQWNFDDPASGSNNTSNDASPDHVFTSPGTYNVQLIASNCLGADTSEKVITIEDFPVFSIGNDTLLCNPFEDTLQLTVSLPGGYNYLWSDGGTDSEMNISVPGNYWLNVSSSCGIVTDSIKIGVEDCECAIQIFPDLTAHNSQVTFTCDLKNYPGAHIEIYNVLGQKMDSFKITNQTTAVSFSNFAAGIYLVHLVSKKKSIAVQKVILVK